MPKSFRQLREQSIRLGSGKKYPSRHTVAHRREPHISHELTTSPTGMHDRPKKKLNELVGALALGAAAGALGYRAVTRKGGVVDRVQRERQRKEQLKASIKASEERTKTLKDKLRKASVIKAALNMKEDAPAVSVAGGAVPTITDPTTNYAAQLKKKMNMLRRKKPV
jgi:hypothetical protein